MSPKYSKRIAIIGREKQTINYRRALEHFHTDYEVTLSVGRLSEFDDPSCEVAVGRESLTSKFGLLLKSSASLIPTAKTMSCSLRPLPSAPAFGFWGL